MERSVNQPESITILFYDLQKEKGGNGEIIVYAIIRKLVHLIFGSLKSSKKFDPDYKPTFA
jgi:hypothetical protein